MPVPIGIAGAGRLGQALGKLLRGLGQPVVAIAGRDVSRTSGAAKFIGSSVRPVSVSELPSLASRVLIAVPDDALTSVAQDLASAPQSIAAALHTCGARGPEALAPLQARGTSCGTLHPLQTIPAPEQGVTDLPGSYFGITASGESLDWALEICRLLGGHPLSIPPEQRPLYHAAAVMASNYVVATIDAAVAVLQEAGVAEGDALKALAPLIRSSVANSLAAGTAQALTGPIERGDTQTVASHLRALAAGPDSVRDLYRSAGLHTVALARRKSPQVNRQAIETLLKQEQYHE